MPYEWTEERMRYWQKTLEAYDLSPAALNDLRKRCIVAQGFRCAVCNRDLSGQTCYLDHDHHTGEIRGICCFSCNRFRVARNTRDTAIEVVRYLSNPPAREYLPRLLAEMRAESEQEAEALNTTEG